MSDQNFEIVFYGVLADGADPMQVRKNVAALFKTEPAKVEPLFSGKRFVIKKGLDHATAAKYEAALRKAGALARIENPAAAREEEAPAAKTGPNAAPEAEAAPARADGGALAGVSVDPPGVTLIEPETIEPLQVDTSRLVLDQPGVILIEPTDVPPPEVNLEGVTMAEPGVLLKEPDEVPALEVDLGGMSMAEPGVVLVEPEQVTTPDIDTSRLELS